MPIEKALIHPVQVPRAYSSHVIFYKFLKKIQHTSKQMPHGFNISRCEGEEKLWLQMFGIWFEYQYMHHNRIYCLLPIATNAFKTFHFIAHMVFVLCALFDSIYWNKLHRLNFFLTKYSKSLFVQVVAVSF